MTYRLAKEGGARHGWDLVSAFKTARGERFSMDLETMLGCIMIAENEGYLPRINTDWWHMVWGRYPLALRKAGEGKVADAGVQTSGEQ